MKKATVHFFSIFVICMASWLFVPSLTYAQDQPIAFVTGVTTRTSPFDPPTKDAFVADDGPGLDTGCTYNTSSNHPLLIDVKVDRFVGEVDVNGFLVNPGPLITKGLIPATIEVIMPAFDVDFNGQPPPERDEVLFNGERVGLLNGDNNIWLLNSFRVDIRKVKFPAKPPTGVTPVPVNNRVQINVDLLSSGRWCTAIDWVALVIPIRPEFGLTLEAKAGNKIRQNTSESTIDTIYKQSFDADCKVKVDIGPFDEFPFSGPATSGLFGLFSGEAILHTKIETCPENSISDPEVKVKWDISGTSLQGTEAWAGFEGDVTIKMPDKIGAYTVNFTYTINTKIITLSRKLFVTMSAPLAQVNPPRRAWYEKATAWASGESSDSNILQKLLSGLYSFGGANWRYAYCFGGTIITGPSGNNICIGAPSSPNLKCNWDDLVADPITCNYTDCYVFSDIFENMAATLGVGGLSPLSLFGTLSQGFVTTGAPSIDPAFPGNARPLAGGPYNRYSFSSHSLRKKGLFFPNYYDATFKGIYSNETAFISWNNDGGMNADANGIFYTTVEGAKIYVRPGNVYDSWGNYEYVPPIPLFVATNVSSQASEVGSLFQSQMSATMNAQDIRFTGNVTYKTVDTNGDGTFEALVADPEVQVLTGGEYKTLGILRKGSRIIANRPSFESMLFTQDTLNRPPGTFTLSLQFSGEQIFRSGENGFYDLMLFAIGANSNTSLTVQTPAFDHTLFGELGANITSVADSAKDTDSDGKFDFIEATLNVKIRTLGDYRLQGNLSKNGVSIVNAGSNFTLTSGTHLLKLRFPGRPILRSGLDGPYEGVINIIDATGHTLGSIEFMTQPYNSTRFGALLELDGRFSDQGIDTNSNGLFNILRIGFGANVTQARTFLVSGALKDPNQPRVVFTDTQLTLATGPQMLTLDFSGPLIREQQIDGPYQIEVVVRDPNTFEELERVTLGLMTAAYKFTDFDGFGTAAITLTGNSTDRGVDTNSNGLFNELHVAVEVMLQQADFYQWSARVVDPNGTEMDFDARSGSLPAGTTPINFIFDGEKIGKNGVNGPYFVKGLLMFGNRGANIIATDVAKTQAYAFTQFEGAVSDTTPPTCVFTPGYKSVTGTFIDNESGIAKIEPLFLYNASLTVDPFTPGAKQVNFRLDDLGLDSYLGFDIKITDLGGNSHICDPVMSRLSANQENRPYVFKFRQVDRYLILTNLGLSGIRVDLNGHRFELYSETSNGARTLNAYRMPREGKITIDLQPYLREAENIMRVEIVGPAGTSADLLLIDEAHEIDQKLELQPVPTEFQLSQNYPNPFNPTTTIRFGIPASITEGTRVQLRIYSTLGVLVRTLVDEKMLPGSYAVAWDGRDARGAVISSGIYIYQLVTSDFKQTKRMIILK